MHSRLVIIKKDKTKQKQKQKQNKTNTKTNAKDYIEEERKTKMKDTKLTFESGFTRLYNKL